MSQTLSLTVTGMKCAGCEAGVKTALLALDGVLSVAAYHKDNKVEVAFEPHKLTETQISEAITAAGYQVQ
jgi:copper chaperone CopZ